MLKVHQSIDDINAELARVDGNIAKRPCDAVRGNVFKLRGLRLALETEINATKSMSPSH